MGANLTLVTTVTQIAGTVETRRREGVSLAMA